MARESSTGSNGVEIADELLEDEDEFEIEQKNAYMSIKGFFNKILDWTVVVFGVGIGISLDDPGYEKLLIVSFICVVIAIGAKIFLLCIRTKLTKYLKSTRITEYLLLLTDRIAIFVTFHFIAVLKPLILYEPSDRKLFWIIFFISCSTYIEFLPDVFNVFKTKIKKQS